MMIAVWRESCQAYNKMFQNLVHKPLYYSLWNNLSTSQFLKKKNIAWSFYCILSTGFHHGISHYLHIQVCILRFSIKCIWAWKWIECFATMKLKCHWQTLKIIKYNETVTFMSYKFFLWNVWHVHQYPFGSIECLIISSKERNTFKRQQKIFFCIS